MIHLSIGSHSSHKALFSWCESAIISESIELFDTINQQSINSVYQHFNLDVADDDIALFLNQASNADVDVYALAGDPEWALVQNANETTDYVKRISEFNTKLNSRDRIKGIVFDIEPYSLSQWNKSTADALMKQYIDNMTSAYQLARQLGLHVVICIPYYYEDFVDVYLIDELIGSTCDTVAVMNYYRKKELNHIALELELAQKYDKEIMTIYELQMAGKYGLVPDNTYYELGYEGVIENYNVLKHTRGYENIQLGIHDYEALKEVLKNE